jgi:hypothetical protein
MKTIHCSTADPGLAALATAVIRRSSSWKAADNKNTRVHAANDPAGGSVVV